MKMLFKTLLAAAALIPAATSALAQDASGEPDAPLTDNLTERTSGQSYRAPERPQRPEWRGASGDREPRSQPPAPVQPQPEGQRQQDDRGAGRFDRRPGADRRNDQVDGRPAPAMSQTNTRVNGRDAPGWNNPRVQQSDRQGWNGQQQPRSGARTDDRRFDGARLDPRNLDPRSRNDRNYDDRVQDRNDRRGWNGGGRDDRFGNDGWNRSRGDDSWDRSRGSNGWDRSRGSDGWDRSRGSDGWDRSRGRDRFDDRGGWNRTWRNDRRYDWSGYRTSNRSAYRLPRYYAPFGWSSGYRRFSIGSTLAVALWGEDYWIDDPYAYRLPAAYGPYRWVRYYDDALLIDIRTGRVIDVVNGIFW